MQVCYNPLNSFELFVNGWYHQIQNKEWFHQQIKRKFKRLEELGKSFMNVRKGKGPRHDPCGTPFAVTTAEEE